MPTPEEEAQHPAAADARYRSATKRLIELRRDRKYRILHSENASYGFRRNLLGLRPIAIAIVIAMAGFALVARHGAQQPLPDSLVTLSADIPSHLPLYAIFAADLLYLLAWVVVVRPGFVRQAANEYAEALFKTLE
jgi:hypothetical protein